MGMNDDELIMFASACSAVAISRYPFQLNPPTLEQIEYLINEIHKTTQKDRRVLITTLTKKMAENLTTFLSERAIRVKYLRS